MFRSKMINRTFDTFDWRKIGDYEPYGELPERSLREKLLWLGSLSLELVVFVVVFVPYYLLQALWRNVFPPRPKDVTGELALVTGGGNGLGKALAYELAKAGARVAIVDLDGPAARDTANELCEQFGDHAARPFVCDVSKSEAIHKLKDEVEEQFGDTVSILVNNAGLLAPISIFEGTDEDIKNITNLNILAHFWTIRAFLVGMKEKNHGHVVTISSMAGLLSTPHAAAYAASKYAVRGLSASLTMDLDEAGFSGIHVSCVHPSFIATRKELVNTVQVRVPYLDLKESAKAIILGVRRNQTRFSLPGSLYLISCFLTLLPDAVYKGIWKIFDVPNPKLVKDSKMSNGKSH